MFALRGIAVSFSVFVLVYCILSVAVCFAWQSFRMRVQHLSARSLADSLFWFRIFPLDSGAGLPRSTDRHFGDGHICSWSPLRLLACLRFPSHGQAARRPGPACVLLPVPVMPERVPTMRPCNSKGIRIYIRI